MVKQMYWTGEVENGNNKRKVKVENPHNKIFDMLQNH